MKKVFGFFLIILFFVTVIYVARNDGSHQVDSSSRGPAASVNAIPEQQALVDQMTQVLLSTKTRHDVNPNVQKALEIAAKDAQHQYPGVQIMAAVIHLIPSLEGAIYRFRNIVEPSDWLHMTALFKLRNLNYNNYTYGPHMEALLDFMEYPSTTVGPVFGSVHEAQAFLVSHIAMPLESVIKAAKQMEALPAQNFVFKFDRTLFVGQDADLRFIDPSEAQKLFVKPFHYTMTFLMQRLVGSIYYVAALNLDALPKVTTKIIQDTQINELKGKLRVLGQDLAKGVTPMITVGAILGESDYYKFRDLKVGDKTLLAQDMLDQAYKYGALASHYQMAGYVCGIRYLLGDSKDYSATECQSLEGFEAQAKASHSSTGEDYLFNVNTMLDGFKAKYAAFKQRNYLFDQAGFATITSDVTGGSVTVNLKALFNAKNSPRNFLPTSAKSFVKPGDASSPAENMPAGVYAWNYDHGKPVVYPDYSFGGFLKDTNQSNLYKRMTTIVYTKALAPFAIFLPVPSPIQMFIPFGELVDANN